MSMNNMPNANSGLQQPQQPGTVSQAPAPLATMPSKGIPPKVLAIIVIGIVLTLGIPGFFILNVHGGGGLFVDRHGLPSDIPLPSGVTFKLKDNLVSRGSVWGHEWDWTVDSPNDPTAVRNFYQSNLPSNGWSKVYASGVPGEYAVIGCQSNQSVEVTMKSTTLDAGGFQVPAQTITAPSGGSTLQIVQSNDPGEIESLCRG